MSPPPEPMWNCECVENLSQSVTAYVITVFYFYDFVLTMTRQCSFNWKLKKPSCFLYLACWRWKTTPLSPISSSTTRRHMACTYQGESRGIGVQIWIFCQPTIRNAKSTMTTAPPVLWHVSKSFRPSFLSAVGRICAIDHGNVSCHWYQWCSALYAETCPPVIWTGKNRCGRVGRNMKEEK